MNSIIYLLQVTACTAVFYLFYFLLLNRLTFFTTNRWYLLATVLLSFIIPLIKLPVNQRHVYTGVVQQVVYTYSPQEFIPIVIHPEVVKTNPIHWGTVLKFVYLSAVIILTIHLIITLFAFFKRLRNKRITKLGNVRVLSGNAKIPNGSFLNYIFLNEQELSSDEIQQIIAHELLHIKLFHSVDRILVKLAQIVLWFNPFIYLYTRSVEENHEFEVDRAIASETDKHKYANLLLHLSVAGQGMLYHNFSKVPLKKRITMLFNKPSANMKKVIYALIIPVVLISCLAFARLKSDINNAKKPNVSAYHFYDRVHLKKANGSNYDLGIVHLPFPLPNQISAELLPGDRVGFLIGKKIYNETNINTISKGIVVSLNGNYGIHAATTDNFPGVNIKGYQTIFNFEVTSAAERKKRANSFAAREAYKKTDDYKRKIKLVHEMEGKTYQLTVSEVGRDRTNNKIDHISFNYNGDSYQMDFPFGNGIESTVDINTGDQITVKAQFISFDLLNSDVLIVTPTSIYKGNKKLFPAPVVPLQAKNEKVIETNKELYTRTEIKKTFGGSYDVVKVEDRAGSRAETEVAHNAKVGFFIDHDFYTEDAFLKLSPEFKIALAKIGVIGVTDSVAFADLPKRGFKADLTGYAAVFEFDYKLNLVKDEFKKQADTTKYQKLKQTLRKRAQALKQDKNYQEWQQTDDYKHKRRLSEEISKAGLITIKIRNKVDRGFRFDWKGEIFTLDLFYGQVKQLNKLLQPGDEVQLKVFGSAFGKISPIDIEPAFVIKHGRKIFQLAEADKIPDYPFLLEANKVNYADGQITNIKKYPNSGRWWSAVLETVNGYKFNLAFPPSVPDIKGIEDGDHIRLRFVHPIKTGAKTYRVTDWVSINIDNKGYGIKNPDLFNKYYPEEKVSTATTPQKMLSVIHTSADSSYIDKINHMEYLYGNVQVKYGNTDVHADYAAYDELNNQLFAAGRSNRKNVHRVVMFQFKKDDMFNTADSLKINLKTDKMIAWGGPVKL